MKKAIIVAGFGCSMTEVIDAYIYPIEKKIQDNNPGIPCFRVFTSEFIRKKLLRIKNMDIDNLQISLEKRKSEGYTHIYVISLHIIPGFEYEKLQKAIDQYRDEFVDIQLSRPLLDDNLGEIEIKGILDYLGYEPNQKSGALLIGHGSEHHSQQYYLRVAELLNRYNPYVYFAHIDGAPFIEDTLKDMKKENYEKIHLYPFMIVAGDHAINDIASDDEDSVRSLAIKSGFNVISHLTGLGACNAIHDIFKDRGMEIIER